MSRDLLDLVRELNTLNDDNLADRVIANSDVQWCLSELQDILEEMPTLTPPNEPLTLEQLRKMDRQPVWVKAIGKTGIRCDGWCEVEIREKDPFAYVWWPGSEVEDIAKLEEYGKTWVCYAYPPDHIDREALGCPYCTPDADGYVRKFGAFNIHNGMLETGHCKPQEIKYCPHCSRLLTKEALNEIRKRMRL